MEADSGTDPNYGVQMVASTPADSPGKRPRLGFLVDRDRRIAYKHIGPVTPQITSEKLMPPIERLRR